jgi:hypothetical protein
MNPNCNKRVTPARTVPFRIMIDSAFTYADAVRYATFVAGSQALAWMLVGFLRCVQAKAWDRAARNLASSIGVAALLLLVASHFGNDSLSWPTPATLVVVLLILASVLLAPRA